MLNHDDVDTEDLRPERVGSVYTSRTAKTATIPDEYAKFAGIDSESNIIWRPYCGPHGNYLVIHVEGEQPEGGEVEGIYVGHNELREVEGE